MSSFKVICDNQNTLALVLEQIERLEQVLAKQLEKDPQAKTNGNPHYAFYAGVQKSLFLFTNYHDQIDRLLTQNNTLKLLNKVLQEENLFLTKRISQYETAVELEYTRIAKNQELAVRNRIKEINQLNKVENGRN